MFPKQKNWRLNYFLFSLVCTFISSKSIIARGPFATSLALRRKGKSNSVKVCFDARGAYHAELNEYEVVTDEIVKKEISKIERTALEGADFLMAVSGALVNYWKEQYAFSNEQHVVIPCTLNSQESAPVTIVKENKRQSKVFRKNIGLNEEDIVLVYSGSMAGWQSPGTMKSFFTGIISKDARIKILFLSPSFPTEIASDKNLSSRIVHKWVTPQEVHTLLELSDYGLIIREPSVTNKVSSPTKFAEYLYAGLPVIISEGIGDFTEFVRKHQCGKVVGDVLDVSVDKNTESNRSRMKALATEHFSKQSFIEQYKVLVNHLED